MNDRTVFLNNDQWTDCWQEMCKDLGYVPSWDEYPEYFSCISCDSTDYQIHGHESGLEIVFETAVEAMAFKLRWI